MTIGIYYIRNKIDGKLYVGRSINAESEWSNNHLPKLRHNKHYNPYLQNAWNKYGENNFEHVIIRSCKRDELSGLEIIYIKKLESHYSKKGYNICLGGDAVMDGRHHSAISKAKIAKNSAKIWEGKKFSKEHRQKLSNARKLKKLFGVKSLSFGKKNKNASSSYFGVYKNKKYWTCSVWFGGKIIHIGQSQDEITTARMYDGYIVKNGLPNPLNFPEEYK